MAYLVGVKGLWQSADVASPAHDAGGSLSGGSWLITENIRYEEDPAGWDAYATKDKFYLWLPYGVSAIGRPPSVANYQGRTYIVGCYSYNVVVDEYHRMWKQGIRPPMEAPVITGAAGTGTYAYLSWYDERTGERSTLGPGTEIGSGTPRTWTNLPTRPPDDVFTAEGLFSTVSSLDRQYSADSDAARANLLRPGDRINFVGAGPGDAYHGVVKVGNKSLLITDRETPTPAGSQIRVLPVPRATHLELWLSIAGGMPRQVMRVALGTTSVVESRSAGSLGETFIDNFSRFPRCTINTIYHDRQVLAGDAENPDTIYLSELFYPERYAGLSFKTRNGEPVTSVLGTRDYCLVMTPTTTYILQGYTENDMTLTVADPNIGAVGHLCNTVVHGIPYVWTQEGPYMFNGSWHPLSPENTRYFQRGMQDPITLFENHATADLPRFEFFQGTHDPDWNSWLTGGLINLDYTQVLPQSGGSFTGGRVSIDNHQTPTATQYLGDWTWHTMAKYMRAWCNPLGAVFMPHPVTTDCTEDSFWIVTMTGRARYAYRGISGDYLKINGYRALPRNSNISVVVPCTSIIVSGHNLFGDAGGYCREGKSFKRLWWYILGYLPREVLDDLSNSTCTVELFAGEESFERYNLITAGLTVPNYSTTLVTDTLDLTYIPKGIWEPALTDHLSGRGLTYRITYKGFGGWNMYGSSEVWRFLGYGGHYAPGPQVIAEIGTPE